MGFMELWEAALEEQDTILSCGGRDYDARDVVYATLDAQWALDPARRIVHGRCFTGADYHTNGWAMSRGVECVRYPADWESHGRAAGPIRNSLMLERERPRLVIAFPGGSGTADMVRKARRAGVPVWEIGK